MLSYIKGQLEEIEEDYIVIEAGHVGYSILVPSSLLNELPSIGDQVKIYTYLHVREDAMLLYGFITKDDMEVFKKLIKVNGIGPKGAMGVLSVMTGYELRIAIMNSDLNTICLAPGIGKKTAQKLILDLKDKLKISDYTETIGAAIDHLIVNQNLTFSGEAIEALVVLGYSNHEALQAVKPYKNLESTEAIIKEALKSLALF